MQEKDFLSALLCAYVSISCYHGICHQGKSYTIMQKRSVMDLRKKTTVQGKEIKDRFTLSHFLLD